MATNYWCNPHEDGWQVKAENAEQAASTHDTQQEAWEECKRLAEKSKGEAYLAGRDGQIRERNTYGHDPRNVPG